MQNFWVAKKNRLTSLAAVGWGTWVAYFVAGWCALALFAYGIAIDQYNLDKRQAPGLVLVDEVESRWAWGLGFVGDVCFRLKQNRMGWFCAGQNYLVQGNGHPGNLFFQLSPGTPLKLKAIAGRVTELAAFPDSNEQRKSLVSYGYAIGRVQEELRADQSGTPYVILALLILPAIWAFRRFLLPRVRQKFVRA